MVMASRSKCPVCRRQFTGTGDAQRTRDHIMPIVWGGSASFYGAGVVDRNTRPMCARCKSLRGQVGHCVGALACILAVACDEALPARQVMRRWKFALARPAIGRKAMRAWLRRAGLAPPLRVAPGTEGGTP